MKIAVIGTGYVGLVSGTCFAETGNHVTCVDIDKAKVDSLNQGKITIFEPGLEVLFERNIKGNRLFFTTDIEAAIKDAEVIFLALPTPPGENGSADLTYVLNVAEQLGKLMTDYKVIVDKSTVPVGTADRVREAVAKNYKGEFDIVSNPEFLREGVAVDDFMKPDRVVIGVTSERARKVMRELYAPFVRQGNPILFMDERSAELTKYAANSFLATKISFMNEISQLCELMGADVDMVRIGVGSDQRIGKRFLFPGIGYGGSCFPKDVKALVKSAKDVNYDFKILNAVEAVNANQKQVLIPKMEKVLGKDWTGKKIAVWGLAFKPNTDDIREAPALVLIEQFLKRGAKVEAFDPEAMKNVKTVLGEKIAYSSNMYEALNSADCLVIATEWPVFRNPDFEKINQSLKQPIIFDGRNVFEVDRMEELGYAYYSIGRKDVEIKSMNA
jgi:UDPglucose 6-dehydrogenase